MQAFETVANPGVIFGAHHAVAHFHEQTNQFFEITGIASDLRGIVANDYDDLVLQGKALHPSDIARFDCPDLDDSRMMWGKAEYFRWYFADGKKREAPLDADELIALIRYRDRCSHEDAEHEVFLNSRAKSGDKQMWKLVIDLGYLDWAREFANEEEGVF
ncbi:hypothetical protein [Janthinobacterium sp. MDT1-19]|uniref:hypothetical protein n=1 Tax=Janthinobacterium sp. MDT1-19 TaxID=1259339 RepID=UPI003F273D93